MSNMSLWRDAVPSISEATVFEETNRLRETATIYPSRDNVFRALEMVAPSDVKVVILGQDPYHGPGQAHGLAFSVPEGVKTPPSLRNIFKEIDADIGGGVSRDHSTDLTRWASQGVLLLNATLTVQEAKAKSHFGMGWEVLTDSIIEYLGREQKEVVYMLWGDSARSKARLVDTEQNMVLEAPHPSPLSAYRGFFGCGHFSKANKALNLWGLDPINWIE